MSAIIYPHNYTYEIRNKKGNRYIGVRSVGCNPSDDPYMGSCKLLKEAIAIEGIDNFTKIILQDFNTREEAVQHETELHDKFDVARNPMFYNQARQTSTGFDRSGTKHTEEHKRKLSEAMKGKPKSEEHKRKLSEANKSSLIPPNRKGVKLTEEHKQKISELKKGNSYHKGKKHTEEAKKRISQSLKLRWKRLKENSK